MDLISVLLLTALNAPVFVFMCKQFRKLFFGDKEDFWNTLLHWSFNPHSFFEKEYRYNHVAAILIILCAACCVCLVFLEYHLADRLMTLVRA